MRRLALLIALAAAATITLPATADAHAVLLSTSPADGAIAPQAPIAVRLTFNEPVAPTGARVRVIAPDGADFAVGEPTASGSTLQVAVREGLPEGTTTVAWSAISVDGHRIGGAFAFSVGAPSAPAAVAEAEPEPRLATIAGSTLRALRFAGIVLALGLAAVLAGVWAPTIRSGTAREATAAAEADRAFRRVAVPLAVGAPALVALTGALWFPLEAWASGLSAGELLELRQGTMALAAAVLALALLPVLALAAAGRLPVPPAVALAALLAAVPGLSGHALAQDPSWPASLASWAHVAAAGLWGGGVIALALCLPPALSAVAGATRRGLLLGVVGRFTRLALAGLVVLVASGALAAVDYAGSATAVLETSWGRLVLVKAGLVAVAVLIAIVVRRRGRGSGGALTAEAVLVVLVVAVTGALTGLAPTPVAAEAASATVVTRDVDGRIAQLDISPGLAGAPNEVHLIVVGPTGEPARDAADGSVTLSSETVERLPVALQEIEPGHWAGVVVLPESGRWEAVARFRIGEFEEVVLRGDLRAVRSP